MAIKLTEKAVSKIKEIIASQEMPAETVVRVGIRGQSCSGPAYAFGLDEEYDTNYDDVVDSDGLKVVHNKAYAEALEHVLVDYHDTEEKQGFTFKDTNPMKVLGGCGGGGCGSGGCHG
jgi:iron-sulfur cluster assembly accessory protein